MLPDYLQLFNCLLLLCIRSSTIFQTSGAIWHNFHTCSSQIQRCKYCVCVVYISVCLLPFLFCCKICLTVLQLVFYLLVWNITCGRQNHSASVVSLIDITCTWNCSTSWSAKFQELTFCTFAFGHTLKLHKWNRLITRLQKPLGYHELWDILL